MKYSDLETKNRYYINGRISQYIDAYIRQHKVWTPDQILESLTEQLSENIRKNQFNKQLELGKVTWSSEVADNWLLSTEGQSLAHERMTKKYKKDKSVALTNSPIVERVRIGHKWDKVKYFDIAYGLKDGYNFIGTEELKKYPHRAWTINHVEQQLGDLHKQNIPSAFNLLSTSPIEKAFYEYWLSNYYSERENPALIPEVCGFRSKFYYHTYKGNTYSTHSGVPAGADPSEVRIVNFRYDFFINNSKKKKIALIELDGHETHKTKPQRIIDSIKRNEAAALNIPVIVFTGTQIHSDISACFASINDILIK